jgi:hypothetical protein
MRKSLWVPFGIGIACHIIGVLLVLLFPDTRLLKDPRTLPSMKNGRIEYYAVQHHADESEGLLDPTNSREVQAGRQHTQITTSRDRRKRWNSHNKPLFDAFQDQLYDLKSLFTSSWAYVLCLSIICLTTFGRTVQNILLQYASKRLDVSFSDVSIYHHSPYKFFDQRR